MTECLCSQCGLYVAGKCASCLGSSPSSPSLSPSLPTLEEGVLLSVLRLFVSVIYSKGRPKKLQYKCTQRQSAVSLDYSVKSQKMHVYSVSSMTSD